MQKTFKFAVTVGRSENVALEKLAQTWAVKFGVKYVERGSRGSLGFLLDQERVEAIKARRYILLLELSFFIQVWPFCGYSV